MIVVTLRRAVDSKSLARLNVITFEEIAGKSREAAVHPEAVPQSHKRAYTARLHETLGHELSASGEARPKTESYGHLKMEKRGISCNFKTRKSRKCHHLLGRWDWRKQLWNRRARLFTEGPSSPTAGGNEAAAGQYDLCGQQSGQGSFYGLSGHPEPAAADPLPGTSGLCFGAESVPDLGQSEGPSW